MHPDIGTRLCGKYELVELSGEGGMAEVFRAVTHGAAGFRRPVAVKRILDHIADHPEFVAMFVEEARVVSELSHPNIVQIHDFDHDGTGGYFLVMEWIEGMNLLEWARAHHDSHRETPWHLVSAVGIEVLKALSAAHERRDRLRDVPAPIFHRDVAPQNILMNELGVVKLSDFGLARAMDRARMTAPQMVKGKMSYLAPELTHGEDATVQTDLFSLGIVLWEVLTGRKLFQGDGPLQILSAVREAKVPSLKELRPDVPDALHDTIHQALARDPADRFASARKMIRALANLLRVTPKPTGADILARSLEDARSWTAEAASRSNSRRPAERISTGDLKPMLHRTLHSITEFEPTLLEREESIAELELRDLEQLPDDEARLAQEASVLIPLTTRKTSEED